MPRRYYNSYRYNKRKATAARMKKGKRNLARRARSVKKKISKGEIALSMPYGGDSRPFPKMYKCPMRYAETVTLTSTGGVIANNVWRPDGLFDPNFTGGGHKPLGFDECQNIWFDWCVLGCKVTTTFWFDSDDTVPPDGTNIICGVHLDENNGLDFSGHDSMMEENRVKWKYLSRQRPVIKISKNYSCQDFHGVKDITDDDGLWGNVAANPATDAFLHTFVYSESVSAIPVNVSVLMQYYVQWRNPKDLAQSGV